MKIQRHLLWVILLAGLFTSCEKVEPLPVAPAGQFTFGTTADEFVSGILELQNNDGFLMVGGQKSEKEGLYDMYLIHADAAGNEVFTKTFGTPEADEIGWKIIQNVAGEYVIYGTKSNPDDATDFVQMTFLDANFNQIRQENSENSDGIIQNRELSYLGSKIFEMDGGGYFVSATYGSAPFVIVLQASGKVDRVEFYQEYETPNVGEFLTKRPDGGFALASQFRNDGFESESIRFIMFDAAGNYQTESFVNTTSQGNYPFAISAFADSTYRIYTRSRYSYTNYIYHVDQYLNLILETELNNSGDYAMLRETDNGRVFAAGYDGLDRYTYTGSNSKNVRFKLVANDHREISQAERGGNGSEQIFDMVLTSNGNFAAVGHTTSFGAGGSDAYLIFIED